MSEEVLDNVESRLNEIVNKKFGIEGLEVEIGTAKTGIAEKFLTLHVPESMRVDEAVLLTLAEHGVYANDLEVLIKTPNPVEELPILEGLGLGGHTLRLLATHEPYITHGERYLGQDHSVSVAAINVENRRTGTKSIHDMDDPVRKIIGDFFVSAAAQNPEIVVETSRSYALGNDILVAGGDEDTLHDFLQSIDLESM